MTPLIAAGAASVAGELVSRFASAVTSSGKSASSAVAQKGGGFSQTLLQAAGKSLQQRQMDELREKVWQVPEVAQALASQPVGAVTGAEVRADGSIAISTVRGSFEIAISAESRTLLQQAFQGMAAMGAPRAELLAVSPAGTSAVLQSGVGMRAPGILVPPRTV